ncbi:RNA polymerase, sigma 54 subunit, RpoN [Dethiosulfovibrio peptidovorans DSM 11002]|uniref:RNA polymerase, sigma 54 subunit, RpoN n=1 Tax=Dethiosulfovibrio peptidovorans DSM 11002 TaxID=469381 RepID=D2Z6Y0_9BACT|nr:RNA polymerase sigma 54 subunit RpoN [Dethiosulfovibrio peptidovorans]EFC91227.1 RNA polymerase, sigma 54 subunit, RpoN [Dethiosulfovibrio peptidovorans DSM 11002]
MAWIDPSPRLTQQVRTELLHLPVLIQNLRLLTMPVQELVDTAIGELADNPLYEVNPPRSWQESGILDDLSEEPSLEENLIRQMAQCRPLREERDSLPYELVRYLDHRGYLTDTQEAIADQLELTAERLDLLLERVRDIVEPPGLFARDLIHCLSLQLIRSGKEESDGAKILEMAVDLLGKGDPKDAMERLGWSRSRFDRAMEELSHLDPAPGRRTTAQVVIPELELYPDPDRPAVVLAENLPRIYMTPLTWEDDRVTSMKGRGLHIIQSIARRNASKLSLAIEVAKKQKDYLMSREGAPYPMTMTEMAEKLNRSVSTVQRIASTTWAVTPVGTVPMDRLFSRPLKSRPDMSVAQLRSRIEEASRKGMSDSELSRNLGVPRRTITWHRQRRR